MEGKVATKKQLKFQERVHWKQDTVFESICIYVCNENQKEHKIYSIHFIRNDEEGIKDMHNFSSLFARQ